MEFQSISIAMFQSCFRVVDFIFESCIPTSLQHFSLFIPNRLKNGYSYKKKLGCSLIFNISSPVGIIIVPSTVTYRVYILYFILDVVCQLHTLNSSKQGVIKACPGNYRAGQQSYKGIQLSVSTQFLIVYAPGNFQKRVTLYTHAKMVLKFQAWQNKKQTSKWTFSANNHQTGGVYNCY